MSFDDEEIDQLVGKVRDLSSEAEEGGRGEALTL